MSLLVESIKLLWEVLEEGKANKENTNKQQNEFLKVASKAVRRTLSYIRDENKRDTKTEEELSELWANVAIAARPFDSDLAERCYQKGNYWANPNNWSDEDVKIAGIEIKRLEKEIGNYFKGKARAKKSKQQKTIEKTAKLPKKKMTNLKRNNQEKISKIIKALKELKEALTEDANSNRTQKAIEAVKSSMSPLKETYDLLHQSIRANCNSCTEECMDNIKNALRNYKRGYPALWISLAKQEFIDELEVAKKGMDTKSEGERINTVSKPCYKKAWAIVLSSIIILAALTTLICNLDKIKEMVKGKDESISKLEKQARILRSIEGNIECLFSANWSKGGHPGSLVPISWNKAQFYARIFEKNSNDTSTILFYLNNVDTIKLSESDLKVKLEIRANPSNGPFRQDLEVLKRYNHLLVYVPFIHKGDTIDGKVTLKNVKATFIVNGEKTSEIEHSDYFEIPLSDGDKLPAFQLNKSDLFHNVFRE